MSKVLQYQGYTIEFAPHRLDGAKWQLHILISAEEGRGAFMRQFAVESIYATEQEADIYGIVYGQRLIDGKVEGQSVMGMKTTDRRTTPPGYGCNSARGFRPRRYSKGRASCLTSRRADAASRVP